MITVVVIFCTVIVATATAHEAAECEGEEDYSYHHNHDHEPLKKVSKQLLPFQSRTLVAQHFVATFLFKVVCARGIQELILRFVNSDLA
jgi:hypothetical protein